MATEGISTVESAKDLSPSVVTELSLRQQLKSSCTAHSCKAQCTAFLAITPLVVAVVSIVIGILGILSYFNCISVSIGNNLLSSLHSLQIGVGGMLFGVLIIALQAIHNLCKRIHTVNSTSL